MAGPGDSWQALAAEAAQSAERAEAAAKRVTGENAVTPEQYGAAGDGVTDDFADAVRTAHDLAEVGDIVLLSPACTSFDAFKNFEARGKTFKNIVNSFED